MTFESIESAHEFVTIVRRKVDASVQESVQGSNQVSNGESNGETNQVKPVKVQLTGSQKDIVNFCSVPRSAQEILERIGVSNQTRTRKKYIQPLLDLGVLEMTIPDNPNSSSACAQLVDFRVAPLKIPRKSIFNHRRFLLRKLKESLACKNL